ncbi:MFS transporter [Gulosibacter molinativorax]|uniref:ABC transporter n=1 Tax=Gulosibacter molinativorax TaxID=256821 RepID=A0ABT7C7R5_9MICO|nr:MFS transporter [Gulosibacter molinativorax]MDJ1371286.1 hypothetical protein [Gulosibacter molinativorax]QUY63652.1 Hypotetical protein [Gulosibacter molinativorax]
MNDQQRSTPQPFDDGPRSAIDPHLLPANGRPPRVYQAASDDTIDADEFIEQDQDLATSSEDAAAESQAADGPDRADAHEESDASVNQKTSELNDVTAAASSETGAERSRLDEAVERSRTIPYAAAAGQKAATSDSDTDSTSYDANRTDAAGADTARADTADADTVQADTVQWDTKAQDAHATDGEPRTNAYSGEETEVLDASDAETQADSSDRWKSQEEAQLEEERRRDDEAFESAMLGTTSTEGLIMPPQKRGNRVFALVMAVVTTIVFAIVYALVFAAARFIFTPEANILGDAYAFAATPAFYVPVAFFGVIMIIWSVLSNRAGWWSYVLVSFLLAIVAFIGHYVGIASQDVISAGAAWSTDALLQVIRMPEHLPGALIAFITARETANWIGGLIAARGRRLTRLNKGEQVEYDARVAEERELSAVTNSEPIVVK